MLKTLESRSSSSIPSLLFYLMGETIIKTEAKVKPLSLQAPESGSLWQETLECFSAACFKKQAQDYL